MTSPNIKRDNSLRKMFSWPVKFDPKGTKKTQPVVTPKPAPKKPVVPDKNEKKKRGKKKRKVSLLRSSPSGGRGSRDSSNDNFDQASSEDLRSPPRRAPTIPGLNLSPLPPADTPNRMRQRRRSGRAPRRGRQLRCRNRGCADSEQTFSSDRARERHEQERCSVRIQVKNNKYFHMKSRRIFISQGGEHLVPTHASMNLPEGSCRVPGCRASYQTSQTRQNHERLTHGFVFRNGRTFASFNIR